MRLAILFPGIGYHIDKPLLYYARKIAKENDYQEIICLNYSYHGENIRGNEKKMQEVFEILFQQAAEQLKEIEFSKYEEILFISKSVGTIIASAYAEEHKILCRQILYTPLEQTYQYQHKDAIAFIGSKDPWSDVKAVKILSGEQQVPINEYEDADHSLETTNTLQNIEVLKDVMHKTERYIQNEEKE